MIFGWLMLTWLKPDENEKNAAPSAAFGDV
jgi:hypothetical protein